MLKVTPLRQGSRGIVGTYENANHHAKSLLDLIQFLEKKIPKSNFSFWRQGHNVHILETMDGRKFVLRPFSQKGIGYLGITLSAKFSRSDEMHLYTLYAYKNEFVYETFAKRLLKLAEPPPFHEHLTSEDHEIIASNIEKQAEHIRES